MAFGAAVPLAVLALVPVVGVDVGGARGRPGRLAGRRVVVVLVAVVVRVGFPVGGGRRWLLGGVWPVTNRGGHRRLLDGRNGGKGGFPAIKGWDAATGLGSPNFSKLASAAMAAVE